MKQLVFLFFLIAFGANAEDLEPRMAEYVVISDTIDPSLEPTESAFEFRFFPGFNIPEVDTIIFAMDNGDNELFGLAELTSLVLRATPGDHSFAFYAGIDYREIEINRLNARAGHRIIVNIYFSKIYTEQLMRKPVLYLYPKDTIDVQVEVLPVGHFTFTYPLIENGWNFTCTPDGMLSNESGSYPYLFWESRQEIKPQFFNAEEGAILAGSEAVPYLEKQLTAFGMTSTERADFITYWGPILQNKTNLYIYLLFDEECDAFASLKINPTPESVARFYVLWTEVPSNYSPSLRPQSVPVHQRDGFTVLEWGGAEFNSSLLLKDDL